MTTVPVKGIRIGKDGKLVKTQAKLAVSRKIAQRKSKKVTVARRGKTR